MDRANRARLRIAQLLPGQAGEDARLVGQSACVGASCQRAVDLASYGRLTGGCFQSPSCLKLVHTKHARRGAWVASQSASTSKVAW